MSRHTPILILAATLGLVSCGGSSSGGPPRFAPPPTGSFSNASLNGSYAFTISGTNLGGFFTIAGSLQADGNGNITGGLEDVNASSGIFTSVAISGTYTIGADGRGSAVLNSSINPITLDFVMISPQRGLVIRFDNTASASGTLDRQDSTAFSLSALTGPMVLNLSGVDSNGASIQTVGVVSTDGAGNITGGVRDENDGGAVNTNLGVSGTYSLSGTNGRGVLSLTDALGTIDLAFYIVDATHLKLVEVDNVLAMSGDAYRQASVLSNAALSGQYSFTVAGSAPGPFVAGGVFSADGNGTITGGAEDINNNGSISLNQSLNGNYSFGADGRGTLTLTSPKRSMNFAVYPSTGGVQMLEIDSVVVSGGAAFAQTGMTTNASISGNYGYNLTGVAISGPSDSVAQFNADGNGHLKGSLDLNLAGALSPGLALSGTYSLTSNGRGPLTIKSSSGTQYLVMYGISSSRAIFIEVDSNVIGLGAFEQQP